MGKQETDPDAFETDRRELFARHGLESKGRRAADREGRETYLLSCGEDDRPTILAQGGLSQASEGELQAARPIAGVSA